MSKRMLLFLGFIVLILISSYTSQAASNLSGTDTGLIITSGNETNRKVNSVQLKQSILLKRDQLEERKLIRELHGQVAASNIQFILEGNALRFSNPVYIKNCRYYLPLEDFVIAAGGQVEKLPTRLQIRTSFWEKTVDLEKQCFISDNSNNQLFGETLEKNGSWYLSLIDIARIFDFVTDWNTEASTVSLFYNRYKPERVVKEMTGKDALLRLEDFAAGEFYRHSPEDLAKIRVIADYLEAQSIPYYVAWVPRYMDPKKNIDMDPLTNYSMYNICFIYSLDYLVWHSGQIGIHGYTHQHGKEQSLYGNESGNGIFDSKGQMRSRIEKAITTAKTLNIPYTFFEFPHYAATTDQIEVAEEYFDYIYQHNPSQGHKSALSVQKGDRVVKYLPTPLDHIVSEYDVENMLRKIDNLDPDTMASLFFHPILDYASIKINRGDDGYPHAVYHSDSILHKVIEYIEGKGYSFKTIDAVK